MTQPPGNFPPPGNYPPPPGAGPGFSVVDALTYGWRRYQRNALPWIGITVLMGVMMIVLNSAGGGFDFETVSDGQGGVQLIRTGSAGRYFLFSFIAMIAGWLLQGITYRGALYEVDGRKPSFSDFTLRSANIGQMLLTGLIVGVLTGVGSFLCVIPGLVIAFLSYFAMPFVVDRKMTAIAGIKASWSLISKNVGPLLLLALAVIGINLVGLLLLVVGLLVTLPVSFIASAYAYRTLSGGVVAPA